MTRLPISFTPHHYELTYHYVNLTSTFDFEGTVKIEGQLKSNTTEIVLHAADLNILEAKLNDDISISRLDYDLTQQTITLKLAKPTTTTTSDANATLTLRFMGTLNDQMRGLYRSNYLNAQGEQCVMATTQFEPTDARRAFPCFDEPALKATFTLTLDRIPSHLQCLSNTPPARITSTLSHKTIQFQATPKMSTYLVAWIIGEFDLISKTSAQIVTTVYTTPGKAHMGQFCLETASRALDLYQNLLKVKYPLTKSDLVAIPDFGAGAMENWGLVTYREAKVLVQDGKTSETTRRGIARTVCHELAHMWFGNLATPEFWTQLWLKEGVARFLEFIGIDALFPEWQAWTEFVQSVFGLAQSLDAMESSHPVEVQVNSADEINEIFDAISYAKGASIIRMIYHVIGREAFFEGMCLYLKRFAYSNAVTNDLWQALQEASQGISVVEFMGPWTLQMGYPILILGDKDLRQERFLLSGPNKDETKWPIPVTAKVEGEIEVLGPWIINGPDSDDTNIILEKIETWTQGGKWFKLNVDHTGFYRVAYTTAQVGQLARALTPESQLSVTDRLGLLSDSFASGRAGYSSIIEALELVKGFDQHSDAEYVVWQELSENLGGLANLFREESFFGSLQAFLKRLYKPHFERIGWDAKEGESTRTGTLRATMISMLRTAGDTSVLEEAHKRLLEHNERPIPGDLQTSIFLCALRHDEASTFKILKEMFEDPNTFSEEQKNCLDVMGYVQDPSRQELMLDYIFHSKKVRLQDVLFPLSSLATSSASGGRCCWDYLKSNFDTMKKSLGPMWAGCVGLSVRGLKDASEVEEFFATREAGSAQRKLKQALEIVRTNQARLQRDRDAVAAFFETH